MQGKIYKLLSSLVYMNKEQIIEYLNDFQKKELPQLASRDLKISSNNKIVAIIGPRRAGKTFLIFQMMKDLLDIGVSKKQMLYLNFEDTRLFNLSFEEIRDVLKLHWELYPTDKKDFYIFIDEPQNIEKWEIAVRSLYDEGFKIVITGSSSKLLSKEIATSLRGRSITYTLFPFSFSEYLRLKNKQFDIERLSSSEKASLLASFRDYSDFGGFSEIINELDSEIKLKIITEYFNSVIFRDIVERFRIRNSKVIMWLLKTIVSSASNEVSINKIFLSLKSQGVKVSKNTLYEYFSILEDVFFCFSLNKFSNSERKKDFSINKVYLADNSFRKILGNEDFGKKLENIVFLHLLSKKEIFDNIHYWKNEQQEEVDFIISQGNKVKQLIQVCYNLDDPETKKRECISLLKASDALKCKNAVIISYDKEGEELFEWFGKKIIVKFVPVWKWLLE